MEINRSNYEIYFLDYIDGNLPPGQIDEFLDFLEANPDLAEELKLISEFRLPEDSVVPFPKEKLLKEDLSGGSDFDYRAIAFIEGDLGQEDQDSFLNEVRTEPARQKELDLLMSIHLKPDLNISFPDKKSLIKKDNQKQLIIWLGRIAAIFVLGIFIYTIWPAEKIPAGQTPATLVQKNGINQPPTSTPLNKVEEQLADIPSQPETEQPEESTTRNEEPKKEATVSTLNGEEPLLASREEVPEMIVPLEAAIPVKQPERLAFSTPGTKKTDYVGLDQYLAHKILKAPKGESFTFQNLAKASLHAAENISNERLAVETNTDGKISEINFHSRLLAFSIPVRKNK